MKIDRRFAKRYALVHAAILLCLCLFPLYRTVAEKITSVLPGCFLHDRLFLYCPLCGGTRALAALLRLELRTAWELNAYVTVLVFLLLIFDLLSLIWLLRGKTRPPRIPRPVWGVTAAALLVFGILRNYLMIAHGYDPAGDLGFFWAAFRR